MNGDRALEAASGELAREAELVGAELAVESVIETPGFWILQPNAVAAIRSGRAADSLTSRIPPIVVNRGSGQVTRPFAAAERIRAHTLGPDEWQIPQPPESPSEHDSLDGLEFGPDDVERIQQLAHFRVRRAGRNDIDRLEASLAGSSPDAIETGLADAGIRRAGSQWTLHGDDRISIGIDPERATVSFHLCGNGAEDTAWQFTRADVDVAASIEAALADAGWVRFWF